MSSRAIQNLFACYSEQLKNTKQLLKNLKAIGALTYCRTPVLAASYSLQIKPCRDRATSLVPSSQLLCLRS